MTVSFTLQTPLAVPPEEAFDASLDVDVHLASFAETGEQIVGGVAGGVMAHGDHVTWRARHFGIWWTMTSVISALDRPRMFVDEQQRGPFASFRHEHRFEPRPDGGTDMVDDITFTAPLGVLGVIAEKLVLERHMRGLIEVRNRHLVAHLHGSPAGQEP